MSVFRIYKGKRVGPKDKNYSKGRWYIYKRINGKVIHKAIPEAQTKEQAEIAERKEIERAFDKKYGKGSKETFREFVERVYERYVEQNNTSLATKRFYTRLLKERFGTHRLGDITPQDLRDAQAKFRKRYAASTVNQLMSTTSKIFTLACQEGILDKNPMQYVTRLKEPPPRDRLLSKEEWERLWKALEKDSLLYRLIVLAINLPLRRGQLLAITPDAIDLQNGLLFAKASKGRASRQVPLNNIAIRTLQSMITNSQLPFPLDPRKRWARVLRDAKIKGYRFHDLRHETVTRLVMNGVHSELIRQLYGHSSVKVTQVYMNPEFEAMREAVKSLDVQEVENVQ